QAEAISHYYQIALLQIARNPSARYELESLLTPAEQYCLVIEWNNTESQYQKDACVSQLFEEQVKIVPDATAVSFQDKSLTYEQLNACANQLAQYLYRLGVGPESLVGVYLARSLEMVIALLGVLKAGAAYMPLDPSYPQSRVVFMLEDSRSSMLLTQQKLAANLLGYSGQFLCLDSDSGEISKEGSENLCHPSEAESLAYVIYTSGSTGKPKGTMIPHRALTNHMAWLHDNFSLSEDDAVLQKTPFSFDASVWEFWAPLIIGGKLVIAQPGGHGDARYLIETIKQHKVTTLQLVPTQLQLLLDEGLASCDSLQYLFCGGEILNEKLARQFREQSDAELINLYGPTEATIDTTYWRMGKGMVTGQIIPIGRPIANT